MKWKDIEKRIDNGAKNLVFVTKPSGSTFRVYNYSGSCGVNEFLRHFDVWGHKASCSFTYKDRLCVEGYELPTEIYDFFKTIAMHRAFNRLEVTLLFEEDLEEAYF